MASINVATPHEYRFKVSPDNVRSFKIRKMSSFTSTISMFGSAPSSTANYQIVSTLAVMKNYPDAFRKPLKSPLRIGRRGFTC